MHQNEIRPDFSRLGNLPNSFSEGKTPEKWCEILKELHGASMCSRTLRKRARESGNCIFVGKDMLLLPSHLDVILSIAADARHQVRKEADRNRTKSTGLSRRANTTDLAIKRLETRSQGRR